MERDFIILNKRKKKAFLQLAGRLLGIVG